MGRKILGLDEAGRGAVLGPLVLGGVVIDEDDMEKLKALKVKDSKMLTPKQREELYPKIKALAKDFLVLHIPAHKIDELRKESNLNKIEVDMMAEITNTLKPDVVIIDAPQTSTDKFKAYVEAKLDHKREVIAENYADKKYPVVSAASILAKVERDAEIAKIKEKVGVDFGVGYSHDAKTIKFIEDLVKSGKPLPDYVRKSWETTQEIIRKAQQKSLTGFKK